VYYPVVTADTAVMAATGDTVAVTEVMEVVTEVMVVGTAVTVEGTGVDTVDMVDTVERGDMEDMDMDSLVDTDKIKRTLNLVTSDVNNESNEENRFQNKISK